MTLISIQNEREWVRLCEQVLATPSLAPDPRFDSNTARVENRTALEAAMGAIIGAMTRDEFQQKLADASIAYGNVSSLDDLSDHVALRRRTVTTSSGDTVALPAHPVRWTDLPNGTDRPAGQVPTIGEHSDAIRHEFAAPI